MLTSLVGNLEISQGVNPPMTARMAIPREYLADLASTWREVTA